MPSRHAHVAYYIIFFIVFPIFRYFLLLFRRGITSLLKTKNLFFCYFKRMNMMLLSYAFIHLVILFFYVKIYIFGNLLLKDLEKMKCII